MNSKFSRIYRLCTLSIFLLSSAFFSIKAEKYKHVANEYQIIGAGTAAEGSYLVELSVLVKDKNYKDSDMRRTAVHGVLFQGFVNPSAKNTQKPLAGPANEAEHIDFYTDFFSENGSSVNFAQIVDGSRKLIKQDKLYRITATVLVRKEALLRYLQDAKIVNSLNSIF